jgi:hypothetical protein
MSGRRLILPMSVSMDGFAGRPRTIVWLTTSTGRDHADQRHRLTLEGAAEGLKEGKSRWDS